MNSQMKMNSYEIPIKQCKHVDFCSVYACMSTCTNKKILWVKCHMTASVNTWFSNSSKR